MTTDPTPSRMRHAFQPIVMLTEREDGRFDVTFDWQGDYINSDTAPGTTAIPAEIVLDEQDPRLLAVYEAVDVWIGNGIVIGKESA